MSIAVSTAVAANYNTTIAIDYNDNASYRKCLRQATNMNMDTLQIPWGQMDSDLDEETKDELLYDNAAMTTCMDQIYQATNTNAMFQDLYSRAAGHMFSTDPQIGLAVLFSYDYYDLFHLCLRHFVENDERQLCVYYENLRNKLS